MQLMLPTSTSARACLYCRGADALFDEAGLHVKELPGSDGGADQGGEHQEIRRVELQCRNHESLGGDDPIGLCENRRDDVGQIKGAQHQKYLFDLAIGAAQDEKPHEQARDWNGDVAADVKNFHGCGDSGKFGDYVARDRRENQTP